MMMILRHPFNKFYISFQFDSLVEGLYGEMDSLSKSVQDLTVLTDCTTFHNSYVTALKGVCYKGL